MPEFIVSCIERAGGAAEPRGSDRIDALLPAALDPGGRERDLVLALDPVTLGQETHAELATIGSPLLDALIAHAAARGTTAVGHLTPERLRKKSLREAVERTLLFSNGRVRYDGSDPDVRCSYSVQFNYKVSFLSDERRERFYVIPVNLWSNQVNVGARKQSAAARIHHLPQTGQVVGRIPQRHSSLIRKSTRPPDSKRGAASRTDLLRQRA